MPRNTSGLKRDAGPGRPKGARNKVPGSVKASIRAIYEELWHEDPTLFKDAIRRALQSSRQLGAAFQHVQVAAHYLDGKPKDTIEVTQRGKLIEVIRSENPVAPADADIRVQKSNT